MAPIYDTDVAEERYRKSRWNHYELWEKVEVRLRRRRRLWIGATIGLFLALSAVPIVADRWPKWVGLVAARRLGQEINLLKREASLAHVALRIRFEGAGSTRFVIEKAPSCSSSSAEFLRSGSLELSAGHVLLDRAQGGSLGVEGLVEAFCYDFLAGSDAVLRGEEVIGFGIVPASDLTAGRSDRLSVLTLTGPSAEVAFE
jgi:hypothetical protein